MKIAVLLVMAAGHLLIIAFLIFKLAHIIRYPGRYNAIKGYEGYEKSSWYWDTKKPWSNLDPPQYSIRCCMGLCFFLCIWFVLIYPSDLGLFSPRGADSFFLPFTFLSKCLGVVFAFVVSYIQPIFSAKPIKICFTIYHLFPRKPRHVVWKRSVLILLISCIIYFPIHTIGFFSYGYVEDDKLIISPAFSFNEQVYEYDSISETEVLLNGDGTIDKYFIYNEHGDCFDIYSFGTDKIRDEVLEKIYLGDLKK